MGARGISGGIAAILSLLVSLLASAEGRTPVSSPSRALVLREFHQAYHAAAEPLEIDFAVEVDEASLSEAASAHRDSDLARITITKRLLDNPRLSDDGLRITLCHETGHILGGAPRRNLPPEWDGPRAADGLSFMSSEGQADYYSTLVCFRHLVRGRNHGAVLSKFDSGSSANLHLMRKCNSAHGAATEDSLICQRAAFGALSMLQATALFPISFVNFSTEAPAKTIIDQYPDRQCRLDTLIAGAMCKSASVPKSAALHFNQPGTNTCADKAGSRPRCWYRN